MRLLFPRVVVGALLVLGIASPVYAYVAPVDAPIVDHFRPPADRYSAGNRGVDYGVQPDTPVRTSADGVVSFAGQVGGELFVTVVHEDGLRTSYAYLSRIDVQVGQNLVAGQSIGSTSGRFHFGVRDGDTYLDPETMLDRARSSAHLVPVH